MNDVFLNELASYDLEWIPIGDSSNETYVFEGTFLGNGYSIYNIYEGSLFGNIGESGVVKAVSVRQGDIWCAGGIASVNRGIIAFCENACRVGNNGTTYIGGICGTNYNIVYGCVNIGEVWGTSDAGGIVGINKSYISTVDSCCNIGIVESSGFEAGGIVSANYGWIYDCCNLGTVKDNWGGLNCSKTVAGICPMSKSGEIRNCGSDR